jgi:hypothetical protein
MLDADIRAALRRDLAAAHGDARIIDELGIRQGEVRVDVALVNGSLTGYEVKSPADSLRRLPRQVEVYGQVLDGAAIVLAEQHRAAALAIVPSWWAVLVAVDGADGVRCEIDRPGTPNPAVDARALVELLWHAEAIELLRTRGAARGLAGKQRAAAWDRLVATYSLDELRAEVRAVLKSRTRPLSGTGVRI